MLALTHTSRVLLLVLVVAALARADTYPRGYGLFKRAESSGSSIISPSAAASSSVVSLSPSSSSPAQTSATKTEEPITASPPTTISNPQSSVQISTPTPKIESTSPTPTPPTTSTTPPPPPTTSAPSQIVSVVTQVTLVTESGSTYSKAVEISTTVAVQPTSLADSSNSSGGGLSNSTKAIIGGVVGGVGGLIVVAVLFAVIWRLRSKRKNKVDPDDVLMNGRPYGSASGDKESVGTGTTPFKSTLESYHNPAKPVNASSNF